MGSFFLSFWKYCLGIIIIFLLIIVFSNKFPLIKYFFEKEPPQIEILSKIDGFGTASQELHFSVEDLKSGIELIRVRVDQSRLNKELYKFDVPLNTFKKEVKLVIDGKKEEFKPGNVRVTIEAYDRSLESNGVKLAFDVPVRFDKPEIELLTTQHNAVQGGMELVFYRVKADKIKKTGVRVRDKEFIGFPANLYDSDFETIKGLYFSFFVIPHDFSDKDLPPQIYARNSVGNESSATFYYKVQAIKKRNWSYQVKDISETRFNDSSLKEYLSGLQFSEQHYWTDRLHKVLGTQMSPEIGDLISVTDMQDEKNQIKNELMSFRFPYNKEILSSGRGKVVSIAESKGYGKIAVIDHGFGLTSVFSNLEEVFLRKNEIVELNNSVGKAAQLLHAREPGYEYGVFYQGEPTRAIEWWDQGWVRSHVVNKISDLKNKLGLNVANEQPELVGSSQVIQSQIDKEKLPQQENSNSEEYEDFERGREF